MEKQKEILEIVREIINEFNRPEVDNILQQIPEEELKVLNPFHGFQQKGIINYKDLFRLALEIENYVKVDWKQFNATILELTSRVYKKDQTVGDVLREKIVIKLNNIEEIIKI